MSVDRAIANLSGTATLPRKNGEIVFQAPWEGLAFGLAVVLNEKGLYRWETFRTGLVHQIAAGGEDYYANWLSALENVLVDNGLLDREEIRQRSGEYRNLERDPVF